MTHEYGKWAFLAGLFISFLMAFMSLGALGPILLVILGIIVGLFNIKDSESIKFLIAILVLPIAAGSLNYVPSVSSLLGPVLLNFIAFGGAAALVVAIVTIYKTAHKK